MSQQEAECDSAQVLATECMDLVVTNVSNISASLWLPAVRNRKKNQLQLDFQRFQGFIHSSQYQVDNFHSSDKS